MEGFIYALSNEAMPGLIKIGFTENIDSRMKTLCSTGVPIMFKCILAKNVQDTKDSEKFVFKDLVNYRYNKSREFFKCDYEIIKKSFDKVEGEYIDVIQFNIKKEKKKKKEKILEEKEIEEELEGEGEVEEEDNVIKFTCKRCNISFSRKSNLQTHLKRKNPCICVNNEYNDINIQVLIDKLSKNNISGITYNCNYCGSKFNYTSNKSRHQKTCKKNPNNYYNPYNHYNPKDKSIYKISLLEKTVKKIVSQIQDLKNLKKTKKT